MKSCRNFTLLCLCLFGLGTAFSQIIPARPPVDLFFGYSYVNADTNGATARQSVNGWSTSSAVELRRWLALETEVSGYYDGVDGSDYSFTAGPRFKFRRIFVHALFGDDHWTDGGSAASPALYPQLAYYQHNVVSPNMSAGVPPPAPSSTSTSQDSFAMIFGGGVQWKVAPAWSMRASVDYVGTHHDLSGGSASWQNNVRVGGGIVYTLPSSRRRPVVARE